MRRSFQSLLILANMQPTFFRVERCGIEKVLSQPRCIASVTPGRFPLPRVSPFPTKGRPRFSAKWVRRSYNLGGKGIREMRLLSICCCLWAGLSNGLAESSFERTVLPVLRANCMPCHDQQTHTSGFSVETLKSFVAGGARHGTGVEPGHPEASIVIQMLKGNMKPQMPFGKRLADADLAAIVNWIRAETEEISAALPKQKKYWAFSKPSAAAPPAVRNAGWVRNPIDNFVLAK